MPVECITGSRHGAAPRYTGCVQNAGMRLSERSWKFSPQEHPDFFEFLLIVLHIFIVTLEISLGLAPVKEGTESIQQ